MRKNTMASRSWRLASRYCRMAGVADAALRGDDDEAGLMARAYAVEYTIERVDFRPTRGPCLAHDPARARHLDAGRRDRARSRFTTRRGTERRPVENAR